MQLKALTLHAQGLTKTEAVKKAGYSKSVQNVPSQVFTGTAIVSAVDRFKLQLKDVGLTTEYWATKFKQWSEHPDPKTQQEAYKLYREIALANEIKKPEDSIKRTVTLTEYLNPATPNSRPSEPSPKTPPNSSSEEEEEQRLMQSVAIDEDLKPHISEASLQVEDIPTEAETIKEESETEGELII